MPSPARLSAQRSPAWPRSAGRFCAWIERTRAARPDGLTVTRSPTATAPDSTVPVTTVPAPGEREGAIDREAEAAVAPRARRGSAAASNRSAAQRVDALAGDGRDRHDVGAGQAGAGQRVRDLGGRPPRAASGVDEVGLGQRDDAALDAEQVDDRQMLARLRHDAVVGGDHQQHEIDAGRAGQHVVDEALVARARRRSRACRPSGAGR